MKKLLGAVLSVVAFANTASAEAEFANYYSKGNVFSIQAPKGWNKNEKAKFLSISSPDGAVAITASAYGKEEGSLKEFAQYRYSSVEDFYNPVGGEQALRSGLFREYEGVWPGESSPTYYVVSVSQEGNVYVSLTIVTDRNDFEKNRGMYVRIMESVNVSS